AVSTPTAYSKRCLYDVCWGCSIVTAACIIGHFYNNNKETPSLVSKTSRNERAARKTSSCPTAAQLRIGNARISRVIFFFHERRHSKAATSLLCSRWTWTNTQCGTICPKR